MRIAGYALRASSARTICAPCVKARILALAAARVRETQPQSGAAIKVGKQAFDRQADMPVAEAYGYMAQVMADNLLLADAHEGIGAFLQKRKPAWEQNP